MVLVSYNNLCSVFRVIFGTMLSMAICVGPGMGASKLSERSAIGLVMHEEGHSKSIEISTQEQSPSFYNAAPELTELVVTGKLPPVDERLPVVPMILQPVERVGIYGGTWRRGMLGNRDHANFIRTIGYENLMRWDEQWTRVIPNVAQSVEINEDATEFVFHLRKGMRWSDGAPFSADDILFWYEGIYSHSVFAKAEMQWLFGETDGMVVEKIDETTVTFRFAEPNGLFLQNLAHPKAADPTSYPRHYLERFHAEYNPNIANEVEAAGVSNWVELFELKFGAVTINSIDDPSRWAHSEVPTLHGWVLTNGYSVDSQQVVAKRNPYYWKVDPDGNQLPYIDRIVFAVTTERDDLVTQAVTGEVDMQYRHIATEDSRHLFEEGEEVEKYRLFRTNPVFANQLVLSPNWTHVDPILREIFQNKDFRIGLSYAINRQEIIDEVYGGEGVPYQTAPVPRSPHYNQKLATQYLTYDVDKANAYLDKAGYGERDSEGFRLGPDKNRITFSVDVSDSPWPDHSTIMRDFVKPNWRAVGLDVHVNIMERQPFWERKAKNQQDFVAWASSDGIAVVQSPDSFFPYSDDSSFATPWMLWYTDTGNPLAEEPPKIVQEQMGLYDSLRTTSDQSKQNVFMAEILEISAEHFYVIGIALSGRGFGLVKNNFHNVPAEMPRSWTYPSPAPTNPVQYFIDPQ